MNTSLLIAAVAGVIAFVAASAIRSILEIKNIGNPTVRNIPLLVVVFSFGLVVAVIEEASVATILIWLLALPMTVSVLVLVRVMRAPKDGE